MASEKNKNLINYLGFAGGTNLSDQLKQQLEMYGPRDFYAKGIYMLPDSITVTKNPGLFNSAHTLYDL